MINNNNKWEKITYGLPKGFIWYYHFTKRKWEKERLITEITTGVTEKWEREVVRRQLKINEVNWNIWTVYQRGSMSELERKVQKIIQQKKRVLMC